MSDITEQITNFGFTYVAFGEKYLREAADSATSLKKWMPEAQVALVSDASREEIFGKPALEGKLDLFSHVIQLEPVVAEIHPVYRGFLNKIRGVAASPYQHNVFLDSDTHIAGTLWELFSILKDYDMAVAVAPQRASAPSLSFEQYLNSYHKRPFFTALNTGVLCFNCTSVISEFFESWLQQFIAKAPQDGRYYTDQTLFCDVLSASHVRPMLLSQEYNYRLAIPQQIHGMVKIFHGRPKQGWERHVQLVNSAEGHRVYFPGNGLILLNMENGCFDIAPFSETYETWSVGYGALQKLLLKPT